MRTGVVLASAAGAVLTAFALASSASSRRARAPRPGPGGADLPSPTVLPASSVPFAPPLSKAAAQRWPVSGVPRGAGRAVPYVDAATKRLVGNAAVAFGAARSEPPGRRHAAVDLYAGDGSPIVALADGVVVGTVFGYAIGAGLEAVAVDHASFSCVYAEIRLSDVARRAGARVRAGDRLGTGARNGDGNVMLHLETWKRGRAPKTWTQWIGTPPADLLDPTRMLLALARVAP